MTNRERSRAYKMVLHHTQNTPVAEQLVQDWLKLRPITWYMISIEPYPEDLANHHTHIFVAWKNQHDKHKILKELQKLMNIKDLLVPPPEGEIRDWNRVDVKMMCVKELKQDYDACLNYLQGNTKDKPIGNVIVSQARPCYRRIRLNKDKKYEQYCGLCKETLCTGCCTGCWICQPQEDPAAEVCRCNAINTNDENIRRYMKMNGKKVVTPSPDFWTPPKIDYI